VSRVNVGILYSRIRKDEKLLLNELRERDHEVTKIDVRKQTFDISEAPEEFDDLDIVVDRCPPRVGACMPRSSSRPTASPWSTATRPRTSAPTR